MLSDSTGLDQMKKKEEFNCFNRYYTNNIIVDQDQGQDQTQRRDSILL